MDDKTREFIRETFARCGAKFIEELNGMTLQRLLGREFVLATTANDVPTIVKECLDAWVTSSWETRMGHVHEAVGRFVCVGTVTKAGSAGADMEILRGPLRYVASSKTSGRWGNSGSSKYQKRSFKKTKSRIDPSGRDRNVVTIMCIFAGKTKTSTKAKLADHKVVGQNCWLFLTMEKEFFKDYTVELFRVSAPFRHDLKRAREGAYNRLLADFQETYHGTMEEIFRALAQNLSGNWTPYDGVNYLLDPNYKPPEAPEPKRRRTGKGSKRRRVPAAPKPKRRRAGEGSGQVPEAPKPKRRRAGEAKGSGQGSK